MFLEELCDTANHFQNSSYNIILLARNYLLSRKFLTLKVEVYGSLDNVFGIIFIYLTYKHCGSVSLVYMEHIF